jgi:hypothetical protein
MIRNKGTLITSSLLLIFGLLLTRYYLQTDEIVFRRWMYSDGGLVLTGLPAFTVIFFILGIGVYGFYLVWKRIKPNEISTFVTGKHLVVVKKKNKSWGTLKSLDLVLKDGRLLTFYCTASKVAAMLLNDFVTGQKAELEIKTDDGQDCELFGKNAYAPGIISLKTEKPI